MTDFTTPPDWPALDRLPKEAQEQIAAAATAVGRIFDELPNAGFAMRGISLGIAAGFEREYLERGLQSTQRGIRNAFAERSQRCQ